MQAQKDYTLHAPATEKEHRRIIAHLAFTSLLGVSSRPGASICDAGFNGLTHNPKVLCIDLPTMSLPHASAMAMPLHPVLNVEVSLGSTPLYVQISW